MFHDMAMTLFSHVMKGIRQVLLLRLLQIFMYVCVCMYACMRGCVCMCECIYMDVYVYMYVCACVFVHVYTQYRLYVLVHRMG